MHNFVVQTGTRIGSSHIRLGRNNQDGFKVSSGELYGKKAITGVTADGCSNKHQGHNEIGGILVPIYLTGQIPLLLSTGRPLSEIPKVLYTNTLGYLNSIVSQTIPGNALDRLAFVTNHLLCTVFGVVVTEVETLIFWAGDGAYILNGDVKIVDQHDRAEYPGYHLLDPRDLRLTAELPTEYNHLIIPTVEIQQLTIGTDGLSQALGKDPTVIECLTGHRNPGGLQAALNVKHMAAQAAGVPSPFVDDTTVITIERF